jgi:hypothetical protein
MKKPIDSDRTAELRRTLVHTVNTTPVRRPPLRPRMVVAALTVFALSGAATGGAISAAALAASNPPRVTVDIDVQSLANRITKGDTTLYGVPVVVSSTGITNVELGAKPADATMLLVAMECAAAHTRIDLSIDGSWEFSNECPDGHGGAGTGIEVTDEGGHTLTVDASGRFLLWASWASEPPTPEPSPAQQAEIADDVITWEEYRAAFNRYADCSEKAGNPLDGFQVLDTQQQIVFGPSNEGVESGTDRICYASEFEQVDTMWQLARQ